MKNQNVVLDFTLNKSVENVIAGQPVALMPAYLAKRLLTSYISSLTRVSANNVIAVFRARLAACETVEESVVCAIEYIQERELIDNIANENWDAYKADKPDTDLVTITKEEV